MRFFRLILAVIFAVSPLAGGPLPGTRQTQPSGTVDSLIQDLADPDPARRTKAAEELRQLGPEARPALVAAARDDASAIAPAASQILVSMPWSAPDDPPAIRQALQSYGRPDPLQRAEAAQHMVTRYPRAVANRVLVRLLREEPSEEVCWRIVALLRQNCDDQTHQVLRELDLQTQTRASALVLAGRSCFVDDRQQAHALLRRAIEIESRRPTSDGGELNFAFDALAGAAIVRGEYDEAAQLRRLQTLRGADSADPSALAVYELFALHGRFGPLSGFEQDLQTYGVYLADPQVLYALGLAYRRCGQTVAASACVQVACGSSLTSRRRAPLADFLRRQRFDELLSVELAAIISGVEPSAWGTRMQARLVQIDLAGRHNDHSAAAKHLQALVDALDKAGRMDQLDATSFRAQVAWRLFRDAQSRGDQADADQHLARLLAANSWNTDIAVDMVPYLRSVGREDAARRMFESEYQKFRAQLQQSPHSAVVLNSIAWLCARSGQRVEEGLELAKRAVEAAPAEAAFLDTLAEAHHQAGNSAEALRLERAVIELEPFDPFMVEQLERFQRGR